MSKHLKKSHFYSFKSISFFLIRNSQFFTIINFPVWQFFILFRNIQLQCNLGLCLFLMFLQIFKLCFISIDEIRIVWVKVKGFFVFRIQERKILFKEKIKEQILIFKNANRECKNIFITKIRLMINKLIKYKTVKYFFARIQSTLLFLETH